MNFWADKALEIVTLEGFIANAKRFKACHVIKKERKMKGILSRLMDEIPAGSGIWDKVREKLFAWRWQLKHLKLTAIKCDDENVILGSLNDTFIEEMSRNSSMFDILDIRKQEMNVSRKK